MRFLSLSEWAAESKLSEHTARVYLERGSLRSFHVGTEIAVLDPPGRLSPRLGRPLSRAGIDELDRAHTQQPSTSRGRSRIAAIRAGEVPLGLLRSWFSTRSDRELSGYVADADLEYIKTLPSFAVSGVTHPDSGLVPGEELEGYLAEADADFIEPVPIPEPFRQSFVRLRISLDPVEVGPLRIICDLADAGDPRASSRANELYEEFSAND